jgi:hypothetical protein
MDSMGQGSGEETGVCEYICEREQERERERRARVADDPFGVSSKAIKALVDE